MHICMYIYVSYVTYTYTYMHMYVFECARLRSSTAPALPLCLFRSFSLSVSSHFFSRFPCPLRCDIDVLPLCGAPAPRLTSTQTIPDRPGPETAVPKACFPLQQTKQTHVYLRLSKSVSTVLVFQKEVQLRDLVKKLIPEVIGKEIEKQTQGIYPLKD